MSKYLYLILFLLLNLSCFSQNENKSNLQKKISKVNLSEKQNEFLKDLPKLLIQAYAQNLLTGYAPSDISYSVSFYEFMKNLGMPLPSNFNESIINCNQNVLVDNSIFMVVNKNFNIHEESYFDLKTSRQVNKITHITLVIPSEFDPKGIEIPLITFSVDEMKKLNINDFYIKSHKNDAIKHSIYNVFIQRLFNSLSIIEGGNILENPAQSNKQIQTKESEKYQNKNEK